MSHTDKVVHAGLFLVLALTGVRAGVPVPRLAGGLLAYAAVSEVVQGALLPDRMPSVADAVADVAGIVLGLALHRTVIRPRS